MITKMSELFDKLNNAKIAVLGKFQIKQDTRETLTKMGFKEEILGSGKSSYIKSGEVKIMQINSLEYLKGLYLVIGLHKPNQNQYRGMVIKIDDIIKESLNEYEEVEIFTSFTPDQRVDGYLLKDYTFSNRALKEVLGDQFHAFKAGIRSFYLRKHF